MEKLLDENNEKGNWIPDTPLPLFPELPDIQFECVIDEQQPDLECPDSPEVPQIEEPKEF